MAEYRDIPDISKQLEKNLKRLPLILCEDISGSMTSKCQLMNEQLYKFFSIKSTEPEVSKRTDIEIIKFNDEIFEPITSTLSSYEFIPFEFEDMSGTTHLWGALDKALSTCKKYFNNTSYWAPWILLYTDGFDNDEPANLKEEVKAKLQAYEKENKIILFILGIGDKDGNIEELNTSELNSISKRGSKVVLYTLNQEMDISCFFQFMMKTITKTISGTEFFVRNHDGTYALRIERIYEAYEESKKLRSIF